MDILLLLLNRKILIVKFQFTIFVSNVRVSMVTVLCPVILTLHSHTYKSGIQIYSYGLWCTIRRVNPDTEHFWPKYDNSHFFNFLQWNNKCTINWQIITLLLHASTLLCHLQGACVPYLLSYTSIAMQYWWYILKFHVCFLLLNLNV
jgi:hypothetical protein